jgi:hypothetical protein
VLLPAQTWQLAIPQSWQALAAVSCWPGLQITQKLTAVQTLQPADSQAMHMFVLR